MIKNIAYIISNNGLALFENYNILKNETKLNCNHKIVIFTEKCLGEKIWENESIEKITITKNWKTERKEICDYLDNLFISKKIDLIILSCGKLLSGKLIDNFKYKILNTHPSLLPSFKGYNVQKKSWDFNYRFMGITTHFIDKECDEGILLCQGCIPFNYNKTLEENNNEWFKLWKIVQVNTIYLIITDKITVHNNKAIFSDVIFDSTIVNPKSTNTFILDYIDKLI